MKSRVTVAVDLAKTVFQVVVADERGTIVERRRLTRAHFERFWEQRPCGRVLMEACGSAHHWGRWLMARGFDVVLLPAHSVTPYVQRNKTDERDAEGLLEAVRSPRVHPVAVKSRDQQQIQALHRIREQWKRTRTPEGKRLAAAVTDRMERAGSRATCPRTFIAQLSSGLTTAAS